MGCNWAHGKPNLTFRLSLPKILKKVKGKVGMDVIGGPPKRKGRKVFFN
jgi:hypothetical protein